MPELLTNTIDVTAAPARINLLGEHTDYTGGLVLPMAIRFFTKAKMDHAVNGYVFRSKNFPGERSLEQKGDWKPAGDWSDYPVGVLHELRKLQITPSPFSLELDGDVPFGAGLSSSASVEVATCLAVLRWTGAMLPPREIALLCQRAENQYVGSPCGIMDQTVITLARKGYALLLNTRDLSTELIPMDKGGLASACVVVINSEIKHSIAAGEYGSIRQQIEAGQVVLREHFTEVQDLGTATIEQLEACRHEMAPESYKRCKHVITENGRVRKAREAMLAGDVERMGKLMTTGHVSQRDDLGTSCEEIDFLVNVALTLDGCFGARMTGGGFGGCTVNLVKREKAAAFCIALRAAYKEHYGIHTEGWVCEAEAGAIAQNRFAADEGAC